MTVNVSKPAINVREKLAELDKPTGIAGEAMLRAETPQEQFNLIGAGRRNILINGGMQVAQRGTSLTLTNTDAFGVDRMAAVVYNTGFTAPTAGTISQTSIYGTTLDGVTFKNAVRITGNSTFKMSYLLQRVEDVTAVSDTTVTVSFYVRADVSATISMQDRVNQYFGSGGSSSVSTVKTAVNRTITTEWQRVVFQIHVPSIAGKTVGYGSHLDFYVFQQQDLSAFGWIEVTGFQVELGKVATPFEHRSYGEELALCQRYFFKMDFPQTSLIGSGWRHTTATVRCTITAPVTMRTTPSINSSGQPTWGIAWTDAGSNYTQTITSGTAWSIVGSSLDNNRITIAAGGISGLSSVMGGLFGYSGDFDFDAEL